MVMPFHDTTLQRAERRSARARRARLWAWPVRLALVLCLGVAVWQEPRLSPWGHARMQEAVAYAQTTIEEAPGAGALMARLGSGGGSSSDGGGGLGAWFVDVMLN